MDRYFKRKLEMTPPTENIESSSRKIRSEFNSNELASDPGLRKKITDYDPNIRDQVRRGYLQRGPCQPKDHNFEYMGSGTKQRRFNPIWFNEFSTWLEYSITKKAAFCLCCYLFKPDIGEQAGGDTFVSVGVSKWSKALQKFRTHVGGPNSAHNIAWRSCEALMKQEQHIETFFSNMSNQADSAYRIQLTASVEVIRFLLRQGLAFRGNDESEDSINQGNYLECLSFYANGNEIIKDAVFDHVKKNLKLIAPNIQKDITHCAANEVVNFIMQDMGDALFSILIDESRDISVKEQMAIVFRYVNKSGDIIERFMGMVHVMDTSALSLKAAIDEFFSMHNLSISRLRGQGYDGASNMQGEFNGLKALILRENESSYSIHCFAHQLQLALVGLAKNHPQINSLFVLIANVVNVVGASCKRRDMLRDKQAAQIVEALDTGELSSGKGQNQSTSLNRSGDTRWGSHYLTLISLITMFSPVIDVLEIVAVDGSNPDQKSEAINLVDAIQSFSFVFSLHLMKHVLGITNELSKALQRKDQDIVNAMSLVKVCKQRLQKMRDDGWDPLLNQVSSFCEKYCIEVPNMDGTFIIPGRSRRKLEKTTNLHYYRVELFYSVIDMQLQELNNRFNEVNSELLICVACLCPDDNFLAFDKQKLIRLAQFYPKDFSPTKLMEIDDQLENYIFDVRSSSNFEGLEGIASLAKKMVDTKRDKVYPLVYFLVTLALLLPVATATVERAFSAMNIVKSRLRNRMGDQWLSDRLVVYIEKGIFDGIPNEAIMQRFQGMATRRGHLTPL